MMLRSIRYVAVAVAAGVMLFAMASCGSETATTPTAPAAPTSTPANAPTSAPTPAPTSATAPSATSSSVAATAAATAAATTAPVDRTADAKAFIEQMANGDFAAAEARVSEMTKSKLPAGGLSGIWKQLTAQMGAYKGMGTTQSGHQQVYDVVVVLTHFEKGDLNTQIAFDAEGMVSGLYFAPAPSATPSPTYEVPAYVNPSSFTEREVTVGSGQWVLTGTLTLPSGGSDPFPAVVLVHGSGPHDRDETIGPNKPFRDLAQGLASQGVAVLRYEKRTLVYGQQMAAMSGSVTVKDEVVDDAVAAVETLRAQKEVDPARIYVVGHSLGGMLAPMIGQAAPDVAGLVILAGTTRPLEQTVLEQYEYLFNLDGTVTDEEKQELDKLKKQIEKLQSPDLNPNTSPDDLPLGLPASYWLSLRGYNPAEVAVALGKPIFVLQGERDYQVSMNEYKGWQDALSGKPEAKLKTYPKLNHLFMPGEGAPNPEEYNNPGHVAGDVIADIAAWVKGQ